MRKSLYFFLLCNFFCISSTQTFAFAAETVCQNISIYDTATPYMDYIAQASCNLYIDSSGNATVKSSVYGYQGITTKVLIDAKLQQYKNGSWQTLVIFTASSEDYRVSLTGEQGINKGYSYRVQATIKAYCGSVVETKTVTSSEANY